jgi:hypothetical protein
MTEASIAPATRRVPPAPRLGAPRLRHTRLAALAAGTQPKALTAVDGAEADFAIGLANAQGRSYVEQAEVPLPDRMQQYTLLLRLEPRQVFMPDFLAQVDEADPLRQQRAVWQLVSGEASALNLMLAYDWRYTLAEADLPKVRGSTQLAGESLHSLAGRGIVQPGFIETLLKGKSSCPRTRGTTARWCGS